MGKNDKRPSKKAARDTPIPEGKGWQLCRHYANSRVPVSDNRLADDAGVGVLDARRMLKEAQKMGWYNYVTANIWMGRL